VERLGIKFVVISHVAVMRHLFLDNFRGFRNASIPITDVNFLVGENSTGKTSVLALVKLLSSQQFWFKQDFGDEDLNFNHFKDMVSAHVEDQSYFRIGLIVERARKKDGRPAVADACLLTYRPHEGSARLREMTVNDLSEEMTMRFGEDTISYKYRALESAPTSERLLASMMRWSADHENNTKEGYAHVKLPAGMSVANMPIMFALSMSPKNGSEQEFGRPRVFIGFP
jgi:hypothetical protein